MSVNSKGGGISFSTREGKILNFSEPKGLKALIQKRNGRKEWIKVSDLRSLKEHSPVNDVFNAIVAAHSPNTP
jgi:hypothetical protein